MDRHSRLTRILEYGWSLLAGLHLLYILALLGARILLGNDAVGTVLAHHGITEGNALLASSVVVIVALLNLVYLRRAAQSREFGSAKALILFALIGTAVFPVGTLIAIATLYVACQHLRKPNQSA